ncbi:hypothetical protein N7603_02510 [Acholeplasma vituli]|uniref:FeoB-associated Cys-rich membrane protein n=1 Tax=Paracholeplasma vituli TaxID=69473 RepID=A0ABT2PXT2_9MOLU|nr:hypothetical protein [Paracholeplasma vituli]MCU0104522.1 hypothetical protein [Paracholeplasma vituli]
MNLIDTLILIFVLGIFLGIAYYRFVQKKTGLGCNCSSKKTCTLKVDSIKAIFEDINTKE